MSKRTSKPPTGLITVNCCVKKSLNNNIQYNAAAITFYALGSQTSAVTIL